MRDERKNDLLTKSNVQIRFIFLKGKVYKVSGHIRYCFDKLFIVLIEGLTYLFSHFSKLPFLAEIEQNRAILQPFGYEPNFD